MSNTAVNVFIYAGRHPDFKEFFTKSLNFLCFRSCCQSKRIHDHSQGKLKKINRRDFLTFSQCLLLVILKVVFFDLGHDFETISQLQLEITRVKRKLSNQYKVKESAEGDIAELDAMSLYSDKSVI